MAVLVCVAASGYGCGGEDGTDASGTTGSSSANGSGGTGSTGTSTGTMSSSSSGSGSGTGGSGGGMENTGPQSSEMVNAGETCTSPSYRMVFTLGQPTQNQGTTTSPSYRMQGGLIGANGSLP